MDNNENEYYKSKIIELIEKCDNLHWLKTIYAYISNLLKEEKSQGSAHCPWLFFTFCLKSYLLNFLRLSNRFRLICTVQKQVDT